jgi:DNA-binding NarL/FixJ family response regulator
MIRVLVGDDLEPVLSGMVTLMEGTDVEVDVAQTSEVAASKLRSRGYDVALFDIVGFNGLELVRRIRSGEFGREASALPILMISAAASEEDCHELAVSRDLSKYASRDCILQYIRRAAKGIVDPTYVAFRLHEMRYAAIGHFESSGGLSEVEEKVLRYVAFGSSTLVASIELEVPVGVIQRWLDGAMAKTHQTSRQEAAKMCFQSRW